MQAREQEADADYRARLAEWQAEDCQCIDLNKAKWATHKLAMNAWNDTRKAAKSAKIPFDSPKPVLETVKQTEKPVKGAHTMEEQENFEQEIADICSSVDSDTVESEEWRSFVAWERTVQLTGVGAKMAPFSFPW